MPTFNTDVKVDSYVDAEVDISVRDFLRECSKREITEIKDWLRDNEYLDSKDHVINHSVNESFFIKHIDNLKERYLQLSREDENTIKKISEKY